MYRNPEKVNRLETELREAEVDLRDLSRELYLEKKQVPKGYEPIGPGDLVKDGAIAFEPHHGNWLCSGNSVGHILNEQGYVSHITHRGWMYANPVKGNEE